MLIMTITGDFGRVEAVVESLLQYGRRTMHYQFGNFTLDTTNFKLSKDGETVAIEPQVFDLIVYLVKNRERLVSRQQIFENIWTGREVCDTSLSNHIKSARKVLGDNGRTQHIIKTTHGRGYQFVAETQEITAHTHKDSHSVKNYRLRYQLALSSFVVLIAFMLINQFWMSDDFEQKSGAISKIAVLPFTNINPLAHSNNEYIGFALADQIIGELAYLNHLAVRPSSSIRKYSSLNNDAISIGKELGVGYVLSGNYLQVDNKIRLNMELVEIETNNLVWRGKQLEVKYKNTFALQDRVARQVVEGLKIKFSVEEFERIKKDIPSNPLAYEYYFKSISYPLTTEGNRLAVEMLKKSIELDKNYAPAYVQLGNRIRRLKQFGLVEYQDYQNTEEYYVQALSLNPELLNALSYLAMYYTETNRIEEAIELANRMKAINPNSSTSHFTLGYIYRYAGLVEEAIEEMEKAVSIDPRNPRFRSLIGAYSGTGEYQKALKMIKLYPENVFTLGWQGILFYRLGNNDLALDYFDRVIENDPDGLWGHVATIHKAYIIGEFDPGFRAIEQLDGTDVVDGETMYYLAHYYGMLGDKQGCLRTLKKAVDAGYFNYTFIKSNDYFDSVREELEFQQILKIAQSKYLAFKEKIDYQAG